MNGSVEDELYFTEKTSGQQKLQQLLFVTPGETAPGQANVMDFYCKLS